MLDYSVCNKCGKEIEEKGIHFRGQLFCSDECCEEYEKEFQDKDEPELDKLEEDDDSGEDNLDYQDEDDFEEEGDNLLDDDFDIKPEDF